MEDFLTEKSSFCDEPGELALEMCCEEASYKFSESGAFVMGDFEIGRNGLRVKGSDRRTKWSLQREDLVPLSVVGQGGSSTVFKTLHAPSLTLIAQKVILVSDQKKRKQTALELRALYDFSNEWIVDFYDAFVDASDNTVSVLMEYVDGGSLQDCVDESRGSRPTESVLANIAWRVLQGLRYVHDSKGRVHRDIKPANLLLNRKGAVKIADFGIAKDLASRQDGAEEDPQLNSFVGTTT